MKRLLLSALACACLLSARAQTTYTLSSPDGRLRTTIAAGETLTYDIVLDGRTLMQASPIALTLADGHTWGPSARVLRTSRTSVDTAVPSPLYRSAEVRDHYNALTLKMRGDWSVEFRAYDDGIAYRFATTSKKPFDIAAEQAEYRFPDDFAATLPYVAVGHDGDFESQFRNSFENTYTTVPLSKLNPRRLAFLPLVVDAGEGAKLCITESDLDDYPGLYLCNNDGGTSLKGRFAPYPARTVQGGHNNLQMIVEEREPYIARVAGPRTFPWRIAVVGTDTEIAASDLSYLLAAPSKIDDTSWIRPGKVAWEWWNDWNIAGVDFRAGVNTETYKYYIDFAAQNGIEYVILDEGWAVNGQADLMQVVPEIDLPEIVDYGRERSVGIILWAGYWAFDRDMEAVCKHYSDMGIKGFKVDFMDRDDQQMTRFNHRAAATAAKYRLILDLHGTHKPAGLNRTWPNVLNFEGVHGLEQMKWSHESVDQMRYDATIPFIRQVAGPMDYTQGAMRNASRGNYRPINSEPMSQGTRCHQLALYVVLDSPLDMLCDSPTAYLQEPECTEFITAIPTVWDETRILSGRLGEYILMARRKGSTWYVGGITDWTPRDLEADLSFLGGISDAELYRDGANADRKASDYKRETLRIDPARPLRIHLAPGGGFVLKIQPSDR
ncbi:MAG: glycoside hydrolase family 97 protein [Alistipes sp.]|nr:glycoside hydrolase family 97 protein [Alistipes senegalensis]MCM1250529.1 glycoside hydrolase family 97 protein [Alistipes sp.]